MATGRVESRKVRRMSRQVVVALPTWVRKRLGVKPGAEVYWHRHRAGEVVLAATGERVAGTPGRHDLEEELARVTAERDEYKRSLTGLDLAERREVFAAGYMQGSKRSIPVDALLQVILERVNELLGRVPPSRRRRGRPVERVAAPVLDEEPRPDPSPPAVSASGGDAASGGEAPLAAHL